MWPQLMAYLLALGLPSALLYNLKSRSREEAGSLVGVALVIGTVMGLIATLLGILFIPRWLGQYPSEVIRFAQFIMITAPLVLLGLSFSSAMRASDAFNLYNRTRYLPPILTLVLLLLLVWSGYLDPFTSALSYLVPILPISIWSIVWAWRRYSPNLRSFFLTSRNLLSYSMRSWGVSLLTTLANQSDRVFVAGFLEPAAMGLYVVALSLSRVLNAVQGAVAPVLFPKASGRSQEEVLRMTGRAVRFSTAVTLVAAAGLIILGPYVIQFLFSRDFTEATGVFRILAVEAVLFGMTQVLAQAFMALDRPGVVTILQGIGVGLSIPLLIWLVPIYGLLGAGLALFLSTAARFISVYACFPLVLRARPPRLWLTPREAIDAARHFSSRR